MRWKWVGMFPLLAAISCRYATAPEPDVVMTAHVSRSTFRVGDTVTVTVVIANRGREVRSVPSKDCPWPFVVTTPEGMVVGPDFGARECLLDLPSVKLGPGEQLEFTAQWNGSAIRTSPDVPAMLPSGTYLVRGQIVGNAPLPPTVAVTINITA